MGHGFLYQSDAAGRIGAIFARSQNPHGRREKVDFGGSSAARGSPESTSKFAILSDSARYPSGPRERSAKPPFVGSNPTRASKLLVSNQWITAFVSFPESPIWEHLGTTGKRASSDRKSTRLNSSHSQISYAVFCLKKKNTYYPGSGQHIFQLRALQLARDHN